MSRAMQIEKRAAQWLARREESDWSGADQAALDAWLRESTAHEVAYLRLEYGWCKADRLAALRSPVPVLSPDRRGRVRVGASYWALAAMLLLILGVTAWFYQTSRGDRYITQIGDHRTVPLADGSRVELNTDTRVRAQLDDAARTVWLEQGEAYFDVVQHASSPFIVYAGAQRVTALGTKFSVRRDRERVHVSVTEGRVRVENPQHKAVVSPGDTVIAQGSDLRVARKSLEKISQDLSWRRGALVFDQTTLQDAAAQFNRYNRRKLVIADPVVGETRIGGSFEAGNVEAFARLLQQGFGLATEEEGEAIRVSR